MSLSLDRTLMVSGALPMVLPPSSLAATGRSQVTLTVMVNVQGAEVSRPPLAVPPLS